MVKVLIEKDFDDVSLRVNLVNSMNGHRNTRIVYVVDTFVRAYLDQNWDSFYKYMEGQGIIVFIVEDKLKNFIMVPVESLMKPINL